MHIIWSQLIKFLESFYLPLWRPSSLIANAIFLIFVCLQIVMVIISEYREKQQEKQKQKETPPKEEKREKDGPFDDDALQKFLLFLDFLRSNTDLFREYGADSSPMQKNDDAQYKKTEQEEEVQQKQDFSPSSSTNADVKISDEAPENPELESSTCEEGVLEPNSGNGADVEKYSWTQSLSEVSVTVTVEATPLVRRVQQQTDSVLTDLEEMTAERDRLKAELEMIMKEKDVAVAERDGFQTQLDSVTVERDNLQSQLAEERSGGGEGAVRELGRQLERVQQDAQYFYGQAVYYHSMLGVYAPDAPVHPYE